MPTKKKPRPVKKKRARNSTPALRAAALAHYDANGGNLDATARELNIPKTTLHGWIKGRTPLPSPELRTEKKLELSERIEQFAHSLASVSPDHERIRDVAVALGISVDKLLLLTDRANQRSETIVHNAAPPSAWNWNNFTPQQIHEFGRLRAIGLGQIPAEYPRVVVSHDAPEDAQHGRADDPPVHPAEHAAGPGAA